MPQPIKLALIYASYFPTLRGQSYGIDETYRDMLVGFLTMFQVYIFFMGRIL